MAEEDQGTILNSQINIEIEIVKLQENLNQVRDDLNDFEINLAKSIIDIEHIEEITYNVKYLNKNIPIAIKNIEDQLRYENNILHKSTQNQISSQEKLFDEKIGNTWKIISILLAILGIFATTLAFIGWKELKKWAQNAVIDKAHENVSKIINETFTEDFIRKEIREHGAPEIERIVLEFKNMGDERLTDFDEKSSDLLNRVAAKRPSSKLTNEEEQEFLEQNKSIQRKEKNQYTARDWFFSGLSAFKKKQFEEAIDDWNKSNILTPTPVTYSNIGLSLSFLNRHEEALDTYEKAVEIDPKNANALTGKANTLMNLKRRDDALKAYEKALEIEPKNAYDWIERGNTLMIIERHKEALNAFEKAVELDSKDANALTGKGKALANLKRHEEALEEFEKAIEIDPKNSSAWHGKGMTYWQLKRYEDTLKADEKLVELEPDNTHSWISKGTTLGLLKRYKEALDAYEKAIEIDPKNPNAWIGKGNALINTKRYEEALKEFEKAIEIDPKNPNAWIGKGNALINTKRYEEALKEFEKAIEIDPKNPNIWIGKGNALGNLKRHEEALKEFEKALEVDSQQANAWIGKGNSLINTNRHKEALEPFEKAIEINPQNANAWHGKANALAKLRRHEEALKAVEKAIEIDPENAITWNAKGFSLGELKRPVEALEAYEKAIEIDPKLFLAYLNICENYLIQSNYKAALETVKKSSSLATETSDQALILFLECISSRLLQLNTVEIDHQLEEILALQPKIQWSLKQMEDWLEEVNIDSETRNYILAKIDLLKIDS